MKHFLMAAMTIGWLGCSGVEPAPMESSSAAEETSATEQAPGAVTPHLVQCDGGDICATRDACAEMGGIPDGGPCANTRPLAFCCALQ